MTENEYDIEADYTIDEEDFLRLIRTAEKINAEEKAKKVPAAPADNAA